LIGALAGNVAVNKNLKVNHKIKKISPSIIK